MDRKGRGGYGRGEGADKGKIGGQIKGAREGWWREREREREGKKYTNGGTESDLKLETRREGKKKKNKKTDLAVSCGDQLVRTFLWNVCCVCVCVQGRENYLMRSCRTKEKKKCERREKKYFVRNMRKR